MNPLLGRISVDPNVCFGKPCVRGTRIWVSLLLDFLASGATMEQILEDYPQLTRDDILAAIAYGAEMSRGRFVDLPGQSAVKFKVEPATLAGSRSAPRSAAARFRWTSTSPTGFDSRRAICQAEARVCPASHAPGHWNSNPS